MDCSSPGSSIHGIFLARVLEWVAISFCRKAGTQKGRLNFYQGLTRDGLHQSPLCQDQPRDRRVLVSQRLITVVLWVPRSNKYCLRDCGPLAMPF